MVAPLRRQRVQALAYVDGLACAGRAHKHHLMGGQGLLR